MRLKGSWKYATGSLFATVFTVNCQLRENGVLLVRADGTPVVQSVLIEERMKSLCTRPGAAWVWLATGSHYN